jgi:hypothetical protein
MYAITGQLRAGARRVLLSRAVLFVVCEFVMVINEVMTNLTLLELAAIAVALDKEEGAERKRRRWAVHPARSKIEIEGEFVTLYKELIDDEVKFYGYLFAKQNKYHEPLP